MQAVMPTAFVARERQAVSLAPVRAQETVAATVRWR